MLEQSSLLTRPVPAVGRAGSAGWRSLLAGSRMVWIVECGAHRPAFVLPSVISLLLLASSSTT
jgi:hypothetical protein